MKLLRFFQAKEIELSPYRIAKGEEEYRVKREILSTIQKGSNGTALVPMDERGTLRDRNTENG